MVSCGRHPTQFHLIGLMKTKAEIFEQLGERLSDVLVECTDYIHDDVLTAADVANLIFNELEDWMIYYGSMTTAADAIRNALRERVS